MSAIMIPSEPRTYDEHSLENIIFESLSTLPDDFVVVHSFDNVCIIDNVLSEHECDFVVFNPKLGVVFIESKAGKFRYESGRWLYNNGEQMKHGGPYKQAAMNKRHLIDKLRERRLDYILKDCKFHHAVWFPTVKAEDIKWGTLPPEAERKITLTYEDLTNPVQKLTEILNLDVETGTKTKLTESETHLLLRFFDPSCQVFPSEFIEDDIREIKFNRLLNEQKNVLNFLEEQKSVLINGAAGTGKTLIAVERAIRFANQGQKVLFLCYNKYLKEELKKKNENPLIDFYNIDSYVVNLVGEINYTKANIMLDKAPELFPYEHVVIDEGQDFGSDSMEESDLLQTIYNIIEFKESGTFYFFYDRLQLVQGTKLPKFMNDFDCKITLYKNCRNTINIANASLRLINERSPKMKEGSVPGPSVRVLFADNKNDILSRIDSLIEESEKKEIVILTVGTEEKSIVKDRCTEKEGRLLYKGKYWFTTARRFKGLEAHEIILTDIDKHTFGTDKNSLLYYVATSRARTKLSIIASINDDECEELLRTVFKYDKKIKQPKKNLADALTKRLK